MAAYSLHVDISSSGLYHFLYSLVFEGKGSRIDNIHGYGPRDARKAKLSSGPGLENQLGINCFARMGSD